MQSSDNGETSVEIGKIPELRTVNVRRLRRLVSQDVAMEQPVNGELERRDVERYKKFSDSKLRNVRAAVSKWPYETYEARLARKELIRRGEWVDSPLENDYGDAGEELIKPRSQLWLWCQISCMCVASRCLVARLVVEGEAKRPWIDGELIPPALEVAAGCCTQELGSSGRVMHAYGGAVLVSTEAPSGSFVLHERGAAFECALRLLAVVKRILSTALWSVRCRLSLKRARVGRTDTQLTS